MSMKHELRRIFPRSYTTGRSIFRAYPVQRVLRMPRRAYFIYQQRKNNGVLAINLHSTAGFFGTMQAYLDILAYCEFNGLIPYVRFLDGPYYSSKHDVNWFNNYFVSKVVLPDCVSPGDDRGGLRFSSISTTNDLFNRERIDKKLDFPLANKLINHSLEVRDTISNAVESYANQQFFGGSTLGLHYRGSDKTAEAHALTYHDVVGRTKKFIKDHPDIQNLFVTTDEKSFEQYVKSMRWNVRLIFFDSGYYSENGLPVHFAPGGDPYTKGRDALLCCLLLSRCDYCLKSASYLSAWAKIFNPDLPIFLLNQPRWHANWFPDREIWEEQLLRRQ